MKTTIHHWRFEDGWRTLPAFLVKNGKSNREFRKEVIGWHCWVYCDDHQAFLEWMENNCPTADCTPRFNSGDPMITVHITSKDEAAYFMLNFQV